jgi:hypothetical protein
VALFDRVEELMDEREFISEVLLQRPELCQHDGELRCARGKSRSRLLRDGLFPGARRFG